MNKKEAKEILQGIKYFNEKELEALHTLIPELAESDDKKIRKELTDYIKSKFENSCSPTPSKNILASWLAWLEKQAEPIDINPSEFDLRLNKLLKQFETLPKDEIVSSLSFYLNVVQNDGTYKEEEKQDEQKPAEEVKPKFKKGDWVIYANEDTDLITGLCDRGYEVNECAYIPFGCEDDMRYWTIQDAKPGDVLVASDNSIFLYNGLTDDAAKYFVSLTKDGTLNVSDGTHYWETGKAAYPATKEQRDQLEKAMADTGYRWDKEELKLERVEQKPQRTISAEAKEAMYDKPEWSEEDETKLKSAIALLKHPNCACDQTILDKVCEWLASNVSIYFYTDVDRQTGGVMTTFYSDNLTSDLRDYIKEGGEE